jgi:hypothetical protein
MITLNGVKFAKGKRGLIASLFNQGGTATGYYRRTKTGLILFSASGERIGGINKEGVLYGSSMINGQWWHSYRQPDLIPEYGSYSQRCDEARAALTETNNQ